MKSKKNFKSLLVLFLSVSILSCNNQSSVSNSDVSQNESSSSEYTSSSESESSSNETSSSNREESSSKDESSSSTEDSSSSEESSSSIENSSSSEDNSSSDTITYITIAEALKLCENNDLNTRYYIKGTVKKVTNPNYGEMTIEDETGSIYCYGTYDSTGEKRYNELDDQPVAGDEVVLYALLNVFNGTPQIKSGWIIEVKHKQVDESDYVSKTIDECRKAEETSKVKVSGVVAAITYSIGIIPNGFYLADNTNSIYVYDAQIASKLSVGNSITLLGERVNFIIENEAPYANAFGYTGCVQLTNCILKSNDKETKDFDKSWVKESTVKEIMETPITDNITTTIYKVNAVINKKPGDGFINYYINDLDNKTGTYTYTQCNGKDFAWLDEFDGKVCEVYLSAINAKSTVSGCFWRILPIQVKDNNYQFDLSSTAKFVVDYYGYDQFLTNYTGDPKLKLNTTISSTLLGFENATLSYTSSNENVVYFEKENEDLIMHTKNAGTATITITGKYEQYTYSKTIEITNTDASTINTITVKEAYEADMETTVTVKGIVASSLVNQQGFYLVDETGAIAVKTTSEELAKLTLGNEVVVTGTRTNTIGGKTGQSCILDATVDANYFGKHEYSTASFKDSTLKNLIALEKNYKNTEQVYKIKASYSIYNNPKGKYSNINLVDNEGNSLRLYTSNPSQYEWLTRIIEEGQEFTCEIALVNFNGKQQVGCILAVYLADGTKVANSLYIKSN